jgi:hypothetical protein
MSDTRAPSAPTTGVESEEASRAELVRVLVAAGTRPFIAEVVASIPAPHAPHVCTRPHIDEMQTWNPAYRAGAGVTN